MAAQPQFTDEDIRLWAEIGERCKRIQFYTREMDKEEDAVIELIKDTPLAYSWTKVKELATANQKSSKAQSEQPASEDVPIGRPVGEVEPLD